MKKAEVINIILCIISLSGVMAAVFTIFQVDKHKKAEFTHDIYEEYKTEENTDTLLPKWFHKKELLVLNQADSLEYLNSYTRFLKFYEELNSMYKKDLIDRDMVKDLFYLDISVACSNQNIHHFIHSMRKEYRSECSDSTDSRGMFGALYVWGKRLGVKNVDSNINATDTCVYEHDLKKGESLYQCGGR